MAPIQLIALAVCLATVHGFNSRQNVPHRPRIFSSFSSTTSLPASPSIENGAAEDQSIQWELFNKHHAKGSWKGIW